MGFFSKKNDTENYSSSYESSSNSWSDSSSQSSLNNDDYEDCDFEIDFFKELSNGILVFKIIDDDYDLAGHIIATNQKITIIESSFYEFYEDDKKHLKNQVQKFCDAILF